ncbi:hypothetical protein ANANG_G00119800 [Anguilla anguilla]|uniref:SERTA domain-containing protein n=1 Tax=Anguilla anguilla TaxID=7936 RepID=A0A9D3MF89_ANGAN|nr:hypothetical protein ANANG_G00119800 [Anguilla anguilla]
MGQMGFFSYQTSMRRRNNAIQTASMCRLDGDTTGKEVDQPDALSSSRYLVGRGLPPAEPEGPAYSSSFSSSSSSLSSSSSVDSLFGSFEISSTTSYLTDLALDDIFEDIDTSMYDPTDFSALTSPDEGLKPVPACAPTGALQLCLTDLSELDHIMEVLVQS